MSNNRKTVLAHCIYISIPIIKEKEGIHLRRGERSCDGSEAGTWERLEREGKGSDVIIF